MLGNLSLIDQLPSTRSGLGLGAITEDPREDMISEMTVSAVHPTAQHMTPIIKNLKKESRSRLDF